MSTDSSWTVEKGSRRLDSHLRDIPGARLIGNGSLLLAELESSHDATERRKKIINGKEHRLSVCTPNSPFKIPLNRI